MVGIIKANVEHSELIAELAQQTFSESHVHSASKSDINNFILKTYNTEAIRKEFENNQVAYHLIYHNEILAGFSKIELECPNINISDKNITKLDRIYLLKAFHGKQLGLKLLDFNIALSQQHQQNGIWLVVWTENNKAVDFYKRMGFKIAGAYDFQISETHSNPNHIMYLEYK